MLCSHLQYIFIHNEMDIQTANTNIIFLVDAIFKLAIMFIGCTRHDN